MKDTGTARLPALPAVSTGNVSLDNWIRAVSERLEVREGARGNPAERVVTQRELAAMGLGSAQWTTDSTSIGGVMVQLPGGGFSRVPMDTFTDEIRKTKLYADLVRKIDDVTRFDDVPEQVRSILLQSLADEASKRGAEIRRIEDVIQTKTESLAYSIQDITAGFDGAVAGVRDASYAAASQGYATAGKITTVTARLDNFSDGTAGVATIEAKATATASKTTGLEAQYTVKVSTGGAVAGFGLASTAAANTTPTSSFIIQADKFAVVSSTYAAGLTNTPNVASVPFGVDATGVYIKGSLRIDTAGTTGASLITDVVAAATTAAYGNLTGTPSSTIANSSVKLSAAGVLSGAGGGTVTIGGLGYTGALGATENQTDATTNAAIAGKLNKSGEDTMAGPISLSASNAIVVGTVVSGTVTDGLYLGNAGLVGRKSSATTFSITADGTATFAGALSAATGSLGALTVGSTLTFGTGGSLFSTGKTTYADTDAGFWLGYDPTVGSTGYKFNIGDSTSYLKWSGSALQIRGDISGASSINITGSARINSATAQVNAVGTATGITYGLIVNRPTSSGIGAATRGIVGAATAGAGDQGAGVEGVINTSSLYGGSAIWGHADGTSTTSYGVRGEGTYCYGVSAYSLFGVGLQIVTGASGIGAAAGTLTPMEVNSTVMVANLNSQYWAGLKGISVEEPSGSGSLPALTLPSGGAGATAGLHYSAARFIKASVGTTIVWIPCYI